uniref:Zgc:194224 n=1 Tax=Amphilophus citrinellus TaxID=61819 RepID=A0A3Q0RK74_AMPCI
MGSEANGNNDGDCLFLERVLDKLYDFGKCGYSSHLYGFFGFYCICICWCQARLEVHRFGITGYRKEQQRVFEQDRAVMLGGRPPKKEYVNYKVLQEQIKKQKEKVKEEAQLVRPALSKTTLPSGPGAAPSGQLGRFKNGMLILNSKEIQKIKGSK